MCKLCYKYLCLSKRNINLWKVSQEWWVVAFAFCKFVLAHGGNWRRKSKCINLKLKLVELRVFIYFSSNTQGKKYIDMCIIIKQKDDNKLLIISDK